MGHFSKEEKDTLWDYNFEEVDCLAKYTFLLFSKGISSVQDIEMLYLICDYRIIKKRWFNSRREFYKWTKNKTINISRNKEYFDKVLKDLIKNKLLFKTNKKTGRKGRQGDYILNFKLLDPSDLIQCPSIDPELANVERLKEAFEKIQELTHFSR
jgi:hypothetical protein